MLRSALARIGRALSRDTNSLIDQVRGDVEKLRQQMEISQRQLNELKFLQGTHAALAVSQLETLPTLGAAGFRVSSQWSEDGIIEWLVSKLPMLKQSFVEFGVERYTEANTPFLLQHRNWRGLIADISAEAIDTVKSSDLMWRHDLTAVHLQITRQNINSLFTEHGFAGEIGILSVDIDGNDYWIWDAITVANPGIVICEYNGIFGDVHPLTVPADDNFFRTDKHYSNLYWGTSIGAIRHLGESRGYTLVGSNTEGCNAFFVRNDLAPLVIDRVADKRPRPPLYRESRDRDGTLTHLSGLDRATLISAMPVVNVLTGEQHPLGAIENSLYSKAWRDAIAANES
jgi:hypothetical protein